MKKTAAEERAERLKKAKDAAKPKDLGKCEDCGADIVIEDKGGGNVHCRNGHVYAIGLKKDDPRGLVTQQVLDDREPEITTDLEIVA